MTDDRPCIYLRELAMLPRLIRSTPPGETARAARVAHQAEMLQAFAHHLDDGQLWPLRTDRDALEQRTVEIGGLVRAWADKADPILGERLASLIPELTRPDAL